jgi:hypothetical protein
MFIATSRKSTLVGEGGVCKVVLAIDTEFHGELSKRLVGNVPQ